MDTLAVRLIVPLAGSIEDFHLQVIQPPPCVLEQRQLALRAILGAPNKKGPLSVALLSIRVPEMASLVYPLTVIATTFAVPECR